MPADRGRLCHTSRPERIRAGERGVQVELIRAGNPSLSVDEFDARFDRARSRVRAVARSILGQQHADDIAQDTYLAARSRLDQLRDVSALDRWLARGLDL